MQHYSLTTTLTSTMSDFTFAVTNVYGPAVHVNAAEFLNLLQHTPERTNHAWVIAGDFNLIRWPSDKNNDAFNHTLSSLFNQTVDALALDELPLLDRRFTWSNGREEPTLERLDRIFFNTEMSFLFPNSSITSQSRDISDHTPLLVHLSSNIPKTNTFRFENAWLLHSDFLPSVLPAWHDAASPNDTAGAMAASLKAVRRVAKVWARVKRSPPQLHHNCRFLIYLLDSAEEGRCLTAGEQLLRRLSQDRLALALQERAAAWKQRGKVRAIKEGDCNTKFFHANANHRHRANQIKSIEVDGQAVTAHDAKTTALTAHFQNTLGAAGGAVWDFDVEALYDDSNTISTAALLAPFSCSEAHAAIRGMNAHSAPGPDGFGPSFYKAAWSTVRPRLMALLESFHNLDVELERINRSYIVLIPKAAAAVTVNAFRPICLQNCDVKVASKILTTRLQCELHHLIDLDQTGFLQGRSISESFVYAMELV